MTARTVFHWQKEGEPERWESMARLRRETSPGARFLQTDGGAPAFDETRYLVESSGRVWADPLERPTWWASSGPQFVQVLENYDMIGHSADAQLLRPSGRLELARTATRSRPATGTDLFEIDKPFTKMYLVGPGTALLIRTDEGTRSVSYVLGPGDLVAFPSYDVAPGASITPQDRIARLQVGVAPGMQKGVPSRVGCRGHGRAGGRPQRAQEERTVEKIRASMVRARTLGAVLRGIDPHQDQFRDALNVVWVAHAHTTDLPALTRADLALVERLARRISDDFAEPCLMVALALGTAGPPTAVPRPDDGGHERLGLPLLRRLADGPERLNRSPPIQPAAHGPR